MILKKKYFDLKIDVNKKVFYTSTYDFRIHSFSIYKIENLCHGQNLYYKNNFGHPEISFDDREQEVSLGIYRDAFDKSTYFSVSENLLRKYFKKQFSQTFTNKIDDIDNI